MRTNWGQSFGVVLVLGCVYLTHCVASGTAETASHRLPIVFVYTVVPAVCKYGLPEYIKVSVEQAIFSQPDCDVIMASNYADCELIAKTVSEVAGLIQIDTTKIESAETKQFANLSTNVFSSDYAGELWITSALRFFILEDIMKSQGYTEILHVEADNTLYGRLTTILPILRSSYPLAATPLTANMGMVTASVFWVSTLETLLHFNKYMMDLIMDRDFMYKKFLGWLRHYACCKKGGIDPDENGMGIKPFAINEMSMLANYHRLYPEIFKFFPVVPSYTAFPMRRPFCNISTFAPNGREVGPATGHGIWDPNSWGQHLGGTSKKKGRDKGFVDSSHIAGQSIMLAKCTVRMVCGNQTTAPYGFTLPVDTALSTVSSRVKVTGTSGAVHGTAAPVPYLGCYTAPFVRCSEESPWTPLWNLHVHSKHTVDYRSKPCDCPGPTVTEPGES